MANQILIYRWTKYYNAHGHAYLETLDNSDYPLSVWFKFTGVHHRLLVPTTVYNRNKWKRPQSGWIESAGDWDE